MRGGINKEGLDEGGQRARWRGSLEKQPTRRVPTSEAGGTAGLALHAKRLFVRANRQEESVVRSV